jgi:hypothetical protein
VDDPVSSLSEHRSDGGLLLRASPLALLVCVTAASASAGPTTNMLGLAVVAPLLAAATLDVRDTTAYASAAVLVTLIAGLADGSLTGPTAAGALRLVGVCLGSVTAVQVARARAARERDLVHVSNVARAVQDAVLGPLPRRLGPVTLAGRSISASRSLRIGGDVYAAELTPHGMRLLVADVRGKGLNAAGVGNRLLGCFRERACEQASLLALAEQLHQAVLRASRQLPDADELFVTMNLLEMTTSLELRLINAGHPRPVLLRGTAAQLLGGSGEPPLGIDVPQDIWFAQLQEGDRLMLYTDGLSEARHPRTGEMLDPVKTAARALAGRPLGRGVDEAVDCVGSWTGGSPDDDVTVVALEVGPEAVGQADCVTTPLVRNTLWRLAPSRKAEAGATA